MTDRGRISQGNCSKLDFSNNLPPAEKWQIWQITATKTTIWRICDNAALDTALVIITHWWHLHSTLYTTDQQSIYLIVVSAAASKHWGHGEEEIRGAREAWCLLPGAAAVGTVWSTGNGQPVPRCRQEHFRVFKQFSSQNIKLDSFHWIVCNLLFAFLAL